MSADLVFLAAGRLRRRSPGSQNWSPSPPPPSPPPPPDFYQELAFIAFTALALFGISIA